MLAVSLRADEPYNGHSLHAPRLIEKIPTRGVNALDSLIILIPIALLFTGLAIAALVWAVKSGQYEDLDRAAQDILFDDIARPPLDNPPEHNTASPEHRQQP